MSEFIRVEINMESCIGISKCGKCVKVCPVNIFMAENEKPVIVEQNQDECTLWIQIAFTCQTLYCRGRTGDDPRWISS